MEWEVDDEAFSERVGGGGCATSLGGAGVGPFSLIVGDTCFGTTGGTNADFFTARVFFKDENDVGAAFVSAFPPSSSDGIGSMDAGDGMLEVGMATEVAGRGGDTGRFGFAA